MKLHAFSPYRWVFAALAWLAAGLSAAHAQATLPRARVDVAYSFQVATVPAAPAGTVYAATGLPTGLSINGSSGTITGKPITAGTYTGAISLTSGGITNSFRYSMIVDPALGTPGITSPATATATVGSAFLYTITANNSPTAFNIGPLPAGLNFSGSTISGTPTLWRSTPYQVAVSANNATGTGATVTLLLTINPAGPVPVITSATAVTAPIGALFSYAITASNTPVSFSAVGLPFGLTLDTVTGVISGTPTIAGSIDVALSATNNNGTGTATVLRLTLGAVSTITNTSPVAMTVNQPATLQLTATNSPLSFNVAGLPPGLTANTTTGFITGTPTTAGAFSVTVSANNATGPGAPTILVLEVTTATTGGGGGGTPGGGGGGGPVITAPIITVQPASQSVTEGANVTFVAAAAGTGPLSYQWQKDGTNIGGATAHPLVLRNVTAADAGSYVAVIRNAGGSVSTQPATLTVTALVALPAFTTQPAPQTAVVGGSASFSVVVASAQPVTYQWTKDGGNIAGATSATLEINAVTAASSGSFAVVATNDLGSTTSSSALLTVTATATLPAILTQPASQTVAPGDSVAFAITATGSGPLTFQWSKDGAVLAGETSAALTRSNVRFADAGSYTVSVTNSAGAVTSAPAVLVVRPPTSRLINLSTRGMVATGERSMIAGFVISGSEPKPVLIRAVGPTLAEFGVTGALADPVLELFSAATSQVANDNWSAAPNVAAIAGTSSRVGAFRLPGSSSDAVILTTLEPGNYTAQMRSNGSAGVGILEIYDASEAPSPTKLINVATRGEVGTGANVLIAGFFVGGEEPKRVLIRAVGPGLAPFGVSNALGDPQLQLFSDGTVLQENDNWGSPAGANAASSSDISSAAEGVGAFGLADGSRDAVLLLTLQPGAYSAHVAGINGATGVALVEVYEVR